MSVPTPGAAPVHRGNGHHDLAAWREHTRVFLQPIAALGRVVLPIGKLYAFSNLSGRNAHEPIEFERGEPGVRHGQ